MNGVNIYSELRHMDLLEEVSNETIKNIANKSSFQIIKEDYPLFFEQHQKDRIYLIIQGKAIVSRFSQGGEEKIIRMLHDDGFINEFSLDGRKTSTSVMVMAGTRLISFEKEDCMNWMKDDFAFNMVIINSLSGKVRSAYRHIRNLGLKKINSRIASRLCKFARDYGTQQANGISIDLSLTQSQLASMVGSTRESVSRYLKQLEREGIIEQNQHIIKIKDLEKLKEYT